MPRLVWFRSIRFRLTAWYALVLVAVFVIFSLSLNTLLERELRQDIDRRLESITNEIKNTARLQGNFQFMTLTFDDPTSLSFPSLLIQIVDNQGKFSYSSNNLGRGRTPVAAHLRYHTEIDILK